MNNITIHCARCGSTNVLLDAYACWNVGTQTWELQNTFDDAVCEDCGGETSLVERELDTSPQSIVEAERLDNLWQEELVTTFGKDANVARYDGRGVTLPSYAARQAAFEKVFSS